MRVPVRYSVFACLLLITTAVTTPANAQDATGTSQTPEPKEVANATVSAKLPRAETVDTTRNVEQKSNQENEPEVSDSDKVAEAQFESTREKIREELTRSTDLQTAEQMFQFTDVFRRKGSFVKGILANKLVVLDDASLTAHEKNHQLSELDIKLQHLTSLETLSARVIRIYENVLNGTQGIGSDMKAQVMNLFTDFQMAALKTKGEYQDMEKKDKEMEKEDIERQRKLNGNGNGGNGTVGAESKPNLAAEIMGGVLNQVSNQADKLEDGMKRDVFVEGQGKKGSSIETVVKVSDDDEEDDDTDTADGRVRDAKIKVGVVTSLIDADNNQYVLTRPGDLTVHYDDIRFLHDIILVLLLSFFCGYICSLFGMPPFFGYIVAGCALGPSGYNIIRSIIQTETLAQLGVMFILFVLGLEFSFELISEIWVVAVGGTISILIITVALFVILGVAMAQAATNEAIFVGACVSLSSTAVVVKCVKTDDLNTLYGVLVVQDLLLGLMLAILPALEKSGLDIVLSVARLFGALITFSFFSLVVARVPITRFLKYIKSSGQHELFLLGVLCFCLLMLQCTEFLGLGMELGCFLAGLIISSSPSLSKSALISVEPVRDLFSCLFFASIGLHVYPSFLINESALVLTLTAGAIGLKWIISTAVFLLFRFEFTNASTMALGLAQVSEFAFVLCSRAKGMQIITREVYYLLLATTSLSLMATPILWRLLFKSPSPPMGYGDRHASSGGKNRKDPSSGHGPGRHLHLGSTGSIAIPRAVEINEDVETGLISYEEDESNRQKVF